MTSQLDVRLVHRDPAGSQTSVRRVRRAPSILLTVGLAFVAALAAGCSSGKSNSTTVSSLSSVLSSVVAAATSAAPSVPASTAAPASTSAAAAGLSGAWSGQYSGAYQGTFKLTWTQTGSTLSGQIALSAPAATVPLNGTVNGNAISFGTVGTVAVTYSGTFSGNSMSGTYQVGSASGGSWSATKSS
jgi:hypothetical protein